MGSKTFAFFVFISDEVVVIFPQLHLQVLLPTNFTPLSSAQVTKATADFREVEIGK